MAKSPAYHSGNTQTPAIPALVGVSSYQRDNFSPYKPRIYVAWGIQKQKSVIFLRQIPLF